MPAAIASECARALGQFDAYHSLLFEKQDSLASGAWTRWAEEAGIEDIPTFEVCVNEEEPKQRIEAGVALALEIGIRSTPTLVINGTVFPGAPSPEALEAIVGSMIEN